MKFVPLNTKYDKKRRNRLLCNCNKANNQSTIENHSKAVSEQIFWNIFLLYLSLLISSFHLAQVFLLVRSLVFGVFVWFCVAFNLSLSLSLSLTPSIVTIIIQLRRALSRAHSLLLCVYCKWCWRFSCYACIIIVIICNKKGTFRSTYCLLANSVPWPWNVPSRHFDYIFFSVDLQLIFQESPKCSMVIFISSSNNPNDKEVASLC